MADAVTTRTLYDDGGHVIIHCTNVSDGTGESAVIKVDASAMVGGGSTTRYAVERIVWAQTGMGFNLLFDADSDVLFFSTGNATAWGDIDYTKSGTGPNGPGITNNAGAGVTGDILLTTSGHTAGDSYVVTIWLRKTAA